jgi:phosphoribosylaminoimidazolecarboxamide formyltransferase / IMP cyclohydrolase
LPRALISVSDKRGVADFARKLCDLGWEIASTGGTARTLNDAGVPVIPIEQVTGFPEILDGRVKTLHPAVHAALLARPDLPEHREALAQHGFTPIELVAVNLYPFRETIAKPKVTLEEAIEQIDIGGPSMLRSAAKNCASVIPIVDPRDYNRVIEMLAKGGPSDESRRELAAKVFEHTASYDVAIAEYLNRTNEPLPPVLGFALKRVKQLRYGENPQQHAALYASHETRGITNLMQLHGKELSFNNILDIDAAITAVSPWTDRPSCAIMKHTTPCGIALGKSTKMTYEKALATDPTSAFGSVIAFNTVVDAQTAKAIVERFVEVVVAPRFHDDAAAVLKQKPNLRVIEIPFDGPSSALDFKRVRGGFLVQERFAFDLDESTWEVVTERHPTDEEWRDLRFAWAAVASIKSNAILLARDEAAIGIGAGQMSRVDASFLAVHKARQAGHDPSGAVLASDAFFPFADGVEEAAKAGVGAIIQPGGAKRDQEVVDAASQHGIAMVFTGRRQFRH